MTTPPREALDRALTLLNAALLSVCDGESDLALVRDADGDSHACVVVGGEIRLVICDPPLSLAATTREH